MEKDRILPDWNVNQNDTADGELPETDRILPDWNVNSIRRVVFFTGIPIEYYQIGM